MRLATFVAGIAISGLAAHAAVAATLTPGSGVVQVNRGKGYAPVSGATQVGPGQQIMVGQGGSATITYPNGCTFSILPGTVISVLSKPPACTAAGTRGSLDALGLLPHDYLIGAGVIAGGVAIGIAANDDKPKSP